MTTRRLAILTGLLVSLQALIPLSFAGAQVDPCSPVVIPGLCNPEPSPKPKPKPKPKPDDDRRDDRRGRGGGIGGGGGGGAGSGVITRRGGGQPGSPGFVLGGPENTADLIETLTRLTRFGVPLRRSVASVVGPFPVAGLAWWADDWHACRDGCTRLHEGLDIFAESGTPLVAAADGVVTQKGEGTLSGLHVEIEDAEGTQYFYAHLSGWADGLLIGQRVRMGQVLGYVGNTGNAVNTPPHVHFEYQPNGVPQPPKPVVDRWLRIAEARAADLVRQYAGEEPIDLVSLDTFRLTRLFDLAGGGVDLSPGSARLLVLAGLQPAASSLEVTRRTIDEMAWEIDWGEHVRARLDELIGEYEKYAGLDGLGGPPFLTVLNRERLDEAGLDEQDLDQHELDERVQPAEVGD
ncbi:MAG TPA: M23 family metallopeptidase [Actinomycetota bacterium]